MLVSINMLAQCAAQEKWLMVGHPNNPPDRNGIGAVAKPFEIMQCEVTAGQYADFLRAVASDSDPHGLWQRAMGDHVITDLGQGGIRMDVPQCIYRTGSPGNWQYDVAEQWEDRPVIFVTCLSAMRYANWLHNGKKTGAAANTETGAYRMADGVQVRRSEDAGYWLPTENEWYKAAYFQPEIEGGPAGSYWQFPMSTNERPEQASEGSELPNAAAVSRGFGGIVPVGSYPNAVSPVGALDMGGNVWEWTEDIIHQHKRVLRGGSAAHTWHKLQASVRSNASPSRWYPDTGFRLARRPEK
jgi:formylglycine-generating enzyme required for sulfatase activity